MFLRGLSRLLAVGMAVILGACSVVLKTDDGQCESDSDCDARGGEFAGSVCENRACVKPAGDPRWGCLGKVVWTEPEPKTINWTLRIQDLLSKLPPPTLKATACENLDPDCNQPVWGPVGPNAEGNIVLQVPAGFAGYVRMLSDDTVPSYLNQAEPLLEDLSGGAEINLLTAGGLTVLASTGGFTLDTTLGVVLVLTRDCTGEPTNGVHLEADTVNAKTQGFYLVGGLPKATATETDVDGNAGYINLPTGYVTLTTKRADTGEEIGHSTIQVRAGSVSYLDLPPTP